jgi:uncharacterized protein (DUF983 family)
LFPANLVRAGDRPVSKIIIVAFGAALAVAIILRQTLSLPRWSGLFIVIN